MKKKLSLYEFTDWISKQEDVSNFFDLEPKKTEDKSNGLVGQTVYLKVSPKKLSERAEIQDGENEKKIFQEFKLQGGEVIEYSGKNLLIKTDSGTFLVPRFCVSD